MESTQQVSTLLGRGLSYNQCFIPLGPFLAGGMGFTAGTQTTFFFAQARHFTFLSPLCPLTVTLFPLYH